MMIRKRKSRESRLFAEHEQEQRGTAQGRCIFVPIKISETNTVLQDYQGLIADHGGMVPQETVLDFISQESERVQMRIEKPGANRSIQN